jgi:hypothetical protein
MPFINNKTKATISGGDLAPIAGNDVNLINSTSSQACYLIIPDISISDVPSAQQFAGRIDLYILPDITDSKSAKYNDEMVMGRSFPIKTYAESDNRSISMKLHFVVWNSNGGMFDPGTPLYNLRCLNLIRSAVYPVDSTAAPYEPPPICKIRCGQLLSNNNDVCVILKQYSVSFPTDCAWDEVTKCPYKFDVDTSWDVVYSTSSLPGQAKIIRDGS